MVRDRARSLSQDAEIWVMAPRFHRDTLTDTVVDLLEVKWALFRLRQAAPQLWRTIEHVDLCRPFAPAGAAGVPDESRRGVRMKREAMRQGISTRAVDEQCRAAWKLVLGYVLDDIHEQVMDVVRDMESRDGVSSRLLPSTNR
jgi:hypothetical protein